MITVTLLLVLSATIITIIAAMGKTQLWIAVLLLCIAGLLQSLPLGK